MTDQNQNNPHSEGPTIDHDANETPLVRKVKRNLPLTIGLGLAIVIGAGAAVSLAQGGWGGPGGWKGAMGARFAEHRISSMLDEIGANDEQEKKIWEIVDKTRSDLRPVGREFRDAREQAVALLSAQTIDKNAIEKLRSERIAALDEASRKAVSAMVEVAEVLTPEQRTKLIAEMKERRGHGHDRDGGRGKHRGGND